MVYKEKYHGTREKREKNKIRIRGLTSIHHIVIQGQTEITKRGRKYKKTMGMKQV